MNEGRGLFHPEDDRGFGQWLYSSNLEEKIHPADKSAAMWAAAHPPEFGQWVSENLLSQVASVNGAKIVTFDDRAAAMNEGRGMFPVGDNARFSEWLATNNLSVANDAERAAAMWAAANPDST